MADHGYAAYAPEDIEDAKRGRPASSLAAWATAHGLDHVAQGLPGQFATVLGLWPDYLFNVCRGELVPGRYGMVAHELEEIAVDERGLVAGGSFFGVRTKGGRGLRGLIGLEKKVPNEPFAPWAAWVPTTKVAVRLPDTALLPRLVVRPSDRMALHNPTLDDAGLPGFRLAESQGMSDGLRRAVGPAVAALPGAGAPFVGLVLDHGLLAIRRNGFVEGEALDQLVATAQAVADGLSGLGRQLTVPQSFALPLPPPQDLSTWPPGFWQPQPHEAAGFVKAAEALGLQPEDAAALHRAVPTIPVPGTAMGVARGTLPGTTAVGRVGFFGQGAHTGGTYRTATMVPARPGAATPLGGQLHAPTDVYAEVADGVACAWPRVRRIGDLDSQASVAAALDTFRLLGLADL